MVGKEISVKKYVVRLSADERVFRTNPNRPGAGARSNVIAGST